MTTTTFRRPTTPLRTPESVWADVLAASGASVPAPAAPAAPETTSYVMGTAAFSCSCPRCLSYGPDRRA